MPISGGRFRSVARCSFCRFSAQLAAVAGSVSVEFYQKLRADHGKTDDLILQSARKAFAGFVYGLLLGTSGLPLTYWLGSIWDILAADFS